MLWRLFYHKYQHSDIDPRLSSQPPLAATESGTDLDYQLTWRWSPKALNMLALFLLSFDLMYTQLSSPISIHINNIQHSNSITNCYSFNLLIKTFNIIVHHIDQYILTFCLTIKWPPRCACASLRRRSTSSVVSLPQCLDCVAWLDNMDIFLMMEWNDIGVWEICLAIPTHWFWWFFIAILLEVTMPSPLLHRRWLEAPHHLVQALPDLLDVAILRPAWCLHG